MSASLSVSAGSRLSASDMNATVVPSAEICGVSLARFALTPVDEADTNAIAPVWRSFT